ncbi:MAG TPA: metal ABC transporter permease [Pilimelia sp.]|nr:metal ABC transporter permease [Pilimelia sp.]
MFASELMLRALLAAVVIGVCAPVLGTYLVQRRMALIGDGIGHVALTGVGVGLLLDQSPVLSAVLVSAACAVGVELVRERGRTPGDLALAVLFYGGIAGGVLLVGAAGRRSGGNLLSYLFGSLGTVSDTDLAVICGLGGAVLLLLLLLRPALFAVCHDEEFAKVSGLPVRTLNLLLAATTAVTVTIAMRAVGLLLVSALMVVPVAAAQQLARGFRATLYTAMAVGVCAAFVGVTVSWQAATAPGATIVLVAIAAFVLATLAGGARRWAARWRRPAHPAPPPPHRCPPRVYRRTAPGQPAGRGAGR